MNKDYLTIGQFAKLSGMSIKALRYYDKINLLKPIYIDEETKYRYYKQNQLEFVNVIFLALELNIPLKMLQNKFIENDKIKFEAFFEYSKKQLNQKIKDLEQSVRNIDLLSNLKRIQMISNFKEKHIESLPLMHFVLIPLNGIENFDKCLAKNFKNYANNKCYIGYLYGVFLTKIDGKSKTYLFFETPKQTKLLSKEHCLFTIDKGNYYTYLSSNISTSLNDSLEYAFYIQVIDKKENSNVYQVFEKKQDI